MKKIALLLSLLLILSTLAGCGSQGVAQQEYDALKEQMESLQKEKEQFAQVYESMKDQLESLEKEIEEARAASEAAEKTAEETPAETTTEEETTPAPTEPETTEPETTTAEEIFDVSETEIRGGTNQADAMQLPMNTKVYGTLHDAQNMYLSFHTGPDAGSKYLITVINKTPMNENARIGLEVVDSFGTELTDGSAYDDGIASTLTMNGLAPDTDYYLRLVVRNRSNSSTKKDTARFATTIRDTRPQAEGVSTTNDLVNAIVPPENTDDLVVGTNQDDSALIPFDKTVSGELKDALGGWFAFATDSNTDSSYLISAVSKSVDDSLRIGIEVFDEFGTEIISGSAYSDGITETITPDDLQPNTVYYIRLVVKNRSNSSTRKDAVGYALTVRRQNNTPVETAEDVVFETPFELSSTQVRFVANQAVFIDENEVKKVLAPVAEIILAHPDHPILLAGTTAKWGSQESCVALSNKRADAVKDLLVSHFGIPESQLITVGLGYEDDPFVRGREIDASGKFVETEGAKNRRVVVLDAESDTAKQILGH